MKLAECLDEVVLGRQDRRTEYQNYHDLSAVIAGTDQHMTKQTVSRVFIISFDLERFQQPADITDDRICSLILDQTFINRHNKMRSLLIDS